MVMLVITSFNQLPSGKHTKSYGKSPFCMGKFTISMVIFNSYVSHNQRVTLKKATESQVFFQNLGIFEAYHSIFSFFWTICEALAIFCNGWFILCCEDDGNDDQ